MFDTCRQHSDQRQRLRANRDYKEVLHVGRKLSRRELSLFRKGLLPAASFTLVTQHLTPRRAHRLLCSYRSYTLPNCLMADSIYLTVLYHNCKLSRVLWALHFHEIRGYAIVKPTEEFMTNSSSSSSSEAGFDMMHGDSNMCNHQGAGKIDEDSISGEDKHAVVSMIRAKRRLSRASGLGTPRHTMAENIYMTGNNQLAPYLT